MTCDHCGGRGGASICPPGWKYFYALSCPVCGGTGEAGGDREDEEAVLRMVAEGCPNDGGES